VTTTADRLARLVAPVADELGVAVYDIEDASGTLRVLLDRPGGVDVDTLSDASRRISRSMDEDGSFSSTSLLEVSSPGLERKLRTPAHLQGAVGERVKVKLRPGIEGDRRIEGTLTAVGDRTITVTPDDGPDRTVRTDDITSAHTVFVWEAAPKPGKGGAKRPARPDDTARPDEPARRDETEATP
jgi:ribosome maturation factor RimP